MHSLLRVLANNSVFFTFLNLAATFRVSLFYFCPCVNSRMDQIHWPDSGWA